MGIFFVLFKIGLTKKNISIIMVTNYEIRENENSKVYLPSIPYSIIKNIKNKFNFLWQNFEHNTSAYSIDFSLVHIHNNPHISTLDREYFYDVLWN